MGFFDSFKDLSTSVERDDVLASSRETVNCLAETSVAIDSVRRKHGPAITKCIVHGSAVSAAPTVGGILAVGAEAVSVAAPIIQEHGAAFHRVLGALSNVLGALSNVLVTSKPEPAPVKAARGQADQPAENEDIIKHMCTVDDQHQAVPHANKPDSVDLYEKQHVGDARNGVGGLTQEPHKRAENNSALEKALADRAIEDPQYRGVVGLKAEEEPTEFKKPTDAFVDGNQLLQGGRRVGAKRLNGTKNQVVGGLQKRPKVKRTYRVGPSAFGSSKSSERQRLGRR